VTTPAVARVIEAVDRERRTLCEALGFSSGSFLDFFYQAGSTTEEAYRSGSVYRALQESEPNRFIRAPEDLTYRFLSEDIPFGLVPMACIGEMLNVSTPTIRSLIDLASLINRTDYRRTGWTPERMGLAGMDRDGLPNYLENG
jgi:opine dehydrogenase